jgi:hypothetical protein
MTDDDIDTRLSYRRKSQRHDSVKAHLTNWLASPSRRARKPALTPLLTNIVHFSEIQRRIANDLNQRLTVSQTAFDRAAKALDKSIDSFLEQIEVSLCSLPYGKMAGNLNQPELRTAYLRKATTIWRCNWRCPFGICRCTDIHSWPSMLRHTHVHDANNSCIHRVGSHEDDKRFVLSRFTPARAEAILLDILLETRPFPQNLFRASFSKLEADGPYIVDDELQQPSTLTELVRSLVSALLGPFKPARAARPLRDRLPRRALASLHRW